MEGSGFYGGGFMKRFLSVLLLVALIVSVLPVTRTSEAAFVGGSGTIEPGGIPGNGGGYVGWGYRVGLVSETMKPGLEIDPFEDNPSIVAKIKQHYNNHFPAMANSIIFVPANQYNSNFVIGFYTASSGNIQYIGNDISDLKLQRLASDFPSTADPYKRISYAKLANQAPFSKVGTKDNAGRTVTLQTLLGDGKWKSLAPSKAQAKQVWNYLLSDSTKIDALIKDYIREEDLNLPNLAEHDSKKYEAKLSYLDLLMTLYAASEGIAEQQNFYASEIERFIEGGPSVSTKPVMLAIDTVVAFTYPSKLKSTWLYIPSTAYVEYAHGGVPAHSILSPNFNGGNAVPGGTRGIIQMAAKNSIAALKTRSRLTDLRGDAYRNNGLMWGYGAVVGAILRTTSSGSISWDSTSSKDQIMKGLTFNGDMYGFMIAGASHNRPSIDCTCQHRLSTTEKGGVISEEKIGKKVPIALDLSVSAAEYVKWEKYLNQMQSQTIKIRLKRTGGTGAGAFSPGENGAVSLDSPQPIDKTQLLQWLKEGTKGPVYYDDLADYTLPEGANVKFVYSAEIEISGRKIGSTVNETKLCAALNTLNVTFSREKKPTPQTASYKSRPSFWSEIKQGEPYGETFEAMAGTVTTRPLYFASGGSEFIVDIEVEYVPNGTATRTYTSRFNEVPSGWNMEEIEGSVGHGEVPDKPAARTKTDISGASYTEKVELISWTHTIKEAVPCSGNPCTGGSPAVTETDYQWIQKGYEKTVGGYSDTWTQTSTFDYMKINKVHVWKLDKSKVNGMMELIGTDEVTATVQQGDPTIFANIANANTSKAGRLRYSLEPDQHDHVIWEEGDSDNRVANSDSDNYVNEKKRFQERRAMTTNVTAISDFLILQTSSGDQSVIYFQKTSNTAKTTEPLTVPASSMAEMWDNNVNSAAQWTVDHIHIGSYNGQYYNPSAKYNGSGNGNIVTTIFDSIPAGLDRTARPAAPLRLMQTNLDVIDTIPNREYITGNASVFYKYLPFNKGTNDSEYASGKDPLYNEAGQSFASTYSPGHSKVNNIVIHNPVSAENAMIISLPDDRDQRTPLTQSIGGNLQVDIIEYDRVLDPYWRPNLLFNGNSELTDSNGLPVGWTPIANNPQAVDFATASGTTAISGTKSFEINTLTQSGSSHYSGQFYQFVGISPNTNYEFKGKLACIRCIGYFYLYEYNAANQLLATRSVSTTNTSNHTEKVMTFRSHAQAVKLRVELLKGQSVGTNASQRDYYYADDISLINKDSATADKPIGFKEVQVLNPAYEPPMPQVNQGFTFKGAVQTWTAPAAGTYTLEVWGAQGGSTGYAPYRSEQATGGYAKGNIYLNKGQTVYIYVGESPYKQSHITNGGASSINPGGWNGGGRGTGAYGGGGGATDIRVGGQTLADRKIVAGGGGGGANERSGNGTGGYGGGTTGGDGLVYVGTNGKGGTQNAGGHPNGSLGQGGDGPGGYSADEGGGGGGYYGGSSGSGEAVAGGGGSGYIGGVTNGVIIGGNQSMPSPAGGNQIGHTGHGYARISSAGSNTSVPKYISQWVPDPDYKPDIPNEAYKLEEIKTPPNASATTPSGKTYEPGNFINLDYGFTVYFPNSGAFAGDHSWGIGQTTDRRGKGFTTQMDTTEWTKSKFVIFDFDVIYNGTMYLAGEEIGLPVPCNSFDCRYEFYAPLNNSEAISAQVTFKSIAINGISLDNDNPTNRVRSGGSAKHSAVKYANVDVVGRIGNLVIEDTGDFRFSNLFKNPVIPHEWLVPQVVRRVDVNSQHQIVGDRIDIRGLTASQATHFLNTYGMTPHLNRQPIPFPLSPDHNNIDALKRQPLRIGYDVFADLQTIGNYYDWLQIIPYFYHLDLNEGIFRPVDIYMSIDSQYVPINLFGAAQPGWDSSTVYPAMYTLDWSKESGRRNYSPAERSNTQRVIEFFKVVDDGNEEHKMSSPGNRNYPLGTPQIMQLDGGVRTFIGSPSTYGTNRNPGSRRPDETFGRQGQRWHFKLGLPSSAVAVKQGEDPTWENIQKLRTNTSVLVMAADIVAVGDTYALRYEKAGINNVLEISETTHPTHHLSYPVIAVFSASRSSADDLSVTGTH